MKLVIPYHYKLYEREGTCWFARDTTNVFYSSTGETLDLLNVKQEFRLTLDRVTIELFPP